MNKTSSNIEESFNSTQSNTYYSLHDLPILSCDEAHGERTDDSIHHLAPTESPFITTKEMDVIEKAHRNFQNKCFWLDDCIDMEIENAFLNECTPERRLSNDWYEVIDMIDLKTFPLSLRNVKDVRYDNVQA
jgi:hypothetical protein